MRELFLIPMLAILFAAVHFLMKRLDRLLAQQSQAQEFPRPDSHTSLRIGLLNPAAADGIEEPLRDYARQYPGVDVSLFYGTEEELLRELSHNRLDVIFVPGGMEVSADGQIDGRAISWMSDPETADKGACLKTEERRHLQQVFWKRKRRTPEVSRFLECVASENRLAGKEGQAVL
ncbi:MAG: LysR substrate-binding domain-containing protein [Candidatus Onthomonas sp.]